MEQALRNISIGNLYYVVDPKKNFDESINLNQNMIIGMSLINIEYENEPCSIILMKNWTKNFNYQSATTHYKL